MQLLWRISAMRLQDEVWHLGKWAVVKSQIILNLGMTLLTNTIGKMFMLIRDHFWVHERHCVFKRCISAVQRT